MKARANSSKLNERIRREGRRPVDDGLLGTYRSRFLIGMCLSVGLAVAAANLPIYPAPEAVHWYAASDSDVIPLYPNPTLANESVDDVYSPMMAEILFDNRVLPAAAKSGDEEEEVKLEAEEEETEAPRLERLERRQILHFAEEMPDIVGGMRSLYLRINYPQAAREQGIEGLVVLSFVVDEEGFVTNLSVLEPVHPLLDSAAVRAVRQTRFTPGRQGNERVKVAMRLPVRFQLIEVTSSVADKSGTNDM